jgi:hypothetical protein
MPIIDNLPPPSIETPAERRAKQLHHAHAHLRGMMDRVGRAIDEDRKKPLGQKARHDLAKEITRQQRTITSLMEGIEQ